MAELSNRIAALEAKVARLELRLEALVEAVVAEEAQDLDEAELQTDLDGGAFRLPSKRDDADFSGLEG